jgi:hypothetical protein
MLDALHFAEELRPPRATCDLEVRCTAALLLLLQKLIGTKSQNWKYDSTSCSSRLLVFTAEMSQPQTLLYGHAACYRTYRAQGRSYTALPFPFDARRATRSQCPRTYK